MKRGKNYKAAAAKYDLSKKYDVASACKMVQDMKYAKFDETVEAHISVRLEKNQTVRDTLVFPNQFRGEKKVLVFCKEDKVQEALDAGAAFAGSDVPAGTDFVTQVLPPIVHPLPITVFPPRIVAFA